ncbi:kell blood group glycoprotein homolog [Musca autumnalis]|uniref:kell blood group glycoprotein homolog n=1 Tax=Musca autumnalis TaxID=221902 RepID=UPI003CF3A228
MLTKLKFVVFFLDILLLDPVQAGEECPVNSSNANCLQLEHIKSSMNNIWNPCENFYGYACGKWSSQHKSDNYASIKEMLDYKYNMELIRILETIDDAFLQEDFFNKTLVYYQSCIKAGDRRHSYSGYLDIIKPGRYLEWPLLWKLRQENAGKQWPAEEFDVYELLGRLWRYGFMHAIIKPEIYKTQNETVVMLTQPKANSLAMANMKDKLKLLGLSVDEAHNTAWLLSSVQTTFHRTYQVYSSQKKSPTFRSTMHYFQAYHPNLYKYIQSSGIQNYLRNVTFKISNIHYFKFIQTKLRSDQQKEDLCNLIMLHLLEHLEEDQGTGANVKLDCIKVVRHDFELPLTFLYYVQIYKPNLKNKYSDMKMIFHQIRKSLMKLVEDKTEYFNIEDLLAHINKTSINVGNQPQTVRHPYVRPLFADIPQLQPDNYYFNRVHLLRHRVAVSWKSSQYRTHVMYSHDTPIVQSSTPFHDSKRNMLILPFGTLQPPIYHVDLHPIFKYSTLGILLAENIFHTTAAGIPYMMPTPPTVKGHFNHIDLDNARVAGATAVSYYAYLNHQPADFLQPDFTQIPWQKLFFLNMAQIFCANDLVDPDLRSKNQFYLEKIMPLFPGFVEAFQCQRKLFVFVDE